jgi:hypothetical protein
MPQGVNVDGSAPVVNLRDTRSGKVAIQAANQACRDIEQAFIPIDCRRIDYKDSPRPLLDFKPLPQLVDQVGPQWYVDRFPVFRVAGFHTQERRRPVQAKVIEGKRLNFTPTQAR